MFFLPLHGFSPCILHVLSAGCFFCSPVPSSCCSHLSSEQRFLSPPSAGISFSPDSSPLGTSPLSHALLGLVFQETQPAGTGTACSSLLVGDPLKSGLPPHGCAPLGLDEAGCFGKRLRGGIEEPVIPCSPFSMPGFLQQGWEGFLLPPTCWGSRKPPGPAAKALGPGAVVSKAVAPEQPVAAGRSGCGGGRQQSQNRCRDGQGNEMVDSRQGERFQNRKAGSVFTSAVGFHFSVLSVITTALASPVGRQRGSAC